MKVKGTDKKFDPVFAENRKARHDYTVLETIECGIVLTGTEVKSVRQGQVSLSGAYGAVLKGELWLLGADIAAYKFGNRFNHEPKSQRKLLAHAKEIADLRLKTEAKGLTLVPLKMFLKQKEKEYIGQILNASGGDKEKAAETLKVNLSTLYRKLSEE